MVADQTVLIHSKGFTYLDTIIWKKSGAVYSIPRSAHIREHQYFYPALQWEPIIIFRLGEMPKFNLNDIDEVSKWHQNVWELSQVVGSQQKKIGHPAIFPLKLPYRILKSYSQRNNQVYDPFLGSGTTLIAAEQTGRICYGMEIAPRYCDVVCRRYFDYTGDLPTLEATGEPFPIEQEA